MAMGSPEWIEESLARLESMEQERDQHESALERATDAEALRQHSEAIDSLDDQIKKLYAALEQVAGEEEAEEEDDVDEVVRTGPFDRDRPVTEAAPPPPEFEEDPFAVPGSGASATPAAAAPALAAAAPAAAPPEDDFEDDPFAVSASASAAAAPVAAAFSDPAPAMAAGGYDDIKTGGSGKWIVLAVLLVGGGVGGYMFWKNNQRAPAPPPAPTEAKVIDATAVPEDTQGPKGAEGQEGVTKTPEREYTGGKRRGGGGKSHGGGGSRPKKSGSDGKAIKLNAGEDPLG